MSIVFKRGPAAIEANLTPMIDVTFLLIIFFVLVSQIVEVENVSMDLPRPTDPATVRQGEEQRTVINLVPAPGGRIRGYRLGTRSFPAGAHGIEALTVQLGTLYASNPQTAVNLRADRGTRYEFVAPVMQAVTDAASRVGVKAVAPRINLVVVRDE